MLKKCGDMTATPDYQAGRQSYRRVSASSHFMTRQFTPQSACFFDWRCYSLAT
jgi:hypothetical protein